ncbi:MAG: tryptophan synthase subunit alpha [Limnochordia bacterium]|jgi:tryptophan synthase alpha chain
MGRISESFIQLRNSRQKALIPFITGGDPSLSTTKAIIKELSAKGADMIEIGVPFSDPLADGPILQASAMRALQGGTTSEKILEMIAELRGEGLQTPLLLLIYYNVIYHKGCQTFAQRAAQAGVDGLIVPDLPLEEGEELRKACEQVGIDLVQLAAPTSTDDRLAAIGQVARGFIYCVSLTGVTGPRSEVNQELKTFIHRLRAHTDVPLAVGFGISSPENAKTVAEMADGVIIGSALVELMHNHDDPVKAAGAFIQEFRQALDGR